MVAGAGALMPQAQAPQCTLRQRDGQQARVTSEELLFDLVYAFAATQISHWLLDHLTLLGLAQTLVLWFAVWLGWQYTCWTTNWFDPQAPRIRGLLLAIMLLALGMAAAIPSAFAERGLVFALCYAGLQVGRTAFLVWELGPGHALSANHRRILGWLLIAALFWVMGGLMEGSARLAWWALAVACEYFSPMVGFALPVLGRSRTSDWTIEGGHLAERCQSFVIVALGEALLSSAGVFSAASRWDAAVVSALLATFVGTLALWWLYFGTSSHAATRAITASGDPGRMGASFHYIHALLIAGIIGCAVGNDLVLAHPHAAVGWPQGAVLLGGPALYLLGSAVYKHVVHGCMPASHIAGALALGLLGLAAPWVDVLVLGWLTTALLLAVGAWELRRGVARHGPASYNGPS